MQTDGVMEWWNQFWEYFDPINTLNNCLFSLSRVAIGVCLASLLAVVFGVVRSALPPRLKNNPILKFLLEAPKFPPPIAWIPFVILAFGIGEVAAYAIVFIGAFAPIFTNTFEGAESIPAAIRNTAKSFEISGVRYLYGVVFKASLPQIFTGLRVGMGMGWMSVIAAEMISGQSGLGYSIQLNRLNLQYDLMVLDMLLIGGIGYLLYLSVLKLEAWLVPWHERSKVNS